ncbi:MAG: DMT family transporter [Sediminibacterium sp.]
MTEKRRARAAVLLANFFFGTSVIAVKHISPLHLKPIALTSIRISCTTLLLWLLYGLRPVAMGIRRKDAGLLFFCAITGISLNQIFSIRGISMTSPVHASLLNLATPIAITIFAALFLKEVFNAFKFVGLLLGISGGALLIFSRDLGTAGTNEQMLGDVFILLGALAYSIYLVAVKPLIAKYRSMHILQWVFLFGAITSLPLGWKDLVAVQWHSFDSLSWFALFYVVVCGTFSAYLLMNYGVNHMGAGVTGSFIYTQPFFATVGAMLLLHESLTPQKIAAALLITGGVFLANYKRRPVGGIT